MIRFPSSLTLNVSPPFDRSGYKYFAVYMPLVIIQWFLAKFCQSHRSCYAASPLCSETDRFVFLSFQSWLRRSTILSRRLARLSMDRILASLVWTR
jgi:hypothetical protein